MDFQTRAVAAPTAQSRIAATIYNPDADPTLCHRFFWLVTQTPALLFETDAGWVTPSQLEHRTNAAYGFLTWAIADAAKPHACWTQFAKAAPKDGDDLFPRDASTPGIRPIPAKLRPHIAWQVWGALICWVVGYSGGTV